MSLMVGFPNLGHPQLRASQCPSSDRFNVVNETSAGVTKTNPLLGSAGDVSPHQAPGPSKQGDLIDHVFPAHGVAFISSAQPPVSALPHLRHRPVGLLPVVPFGPPAPALLRRPHVSGPHASEPRVFGPRCDVRPIENYVSPSVSLI